MEDWKKEYLKLLGCVNVSEMDIDAAQNLKIRNIPKNLYKYRQVSENSLNNLRNNTVWIDRPSNFNDIFEFNENLATDKLYNAINEKHKAELVDKMTSKIDVPDDIKAEAHLSLNPIEFIGRYALKQANYTDDKIDEYFKILNDFANEQTKKMAVAKINDMKHHMKVCCFCESNTELHMWTHYADSHKGFCIEYNTENWFPFHIKKRLLFPVIYQDTVFDATDHIVNYILNSDYNNLYPFISGSTKSTQYQLEKEWRLIFNLTTFAPQNYPMECLNRVFLGAEISNEHKEQILEICKENRVDAYQAMINPSSYTIEFELISQG